jgi:hypothetical protein
MPSTKGTTYNEGRRAVERITSSDDRYHCRTETGEHKK